MDGRIKVIPIDFDLKNTDIPVSFGSESYHIVEKGLVRTSFELSYILALFKKKIFLEIFFVKTDISRGRKLQKA